MDESQVLEGLRNRDMTAFETLFDSFSHLVKYYAEQITKDEQEAEDITVHSFCKFWEQELTNYNSIKQVKNFIYKVAKNSSLKYLRKKKVVRSHQGTIIYLTENEEAYEIERIRYETEVLQRLYAEIDKLPQRTKEAFKLIYINDLSSREAGEKLNISEVTVRRLCSEALQKLRTKFSEKDLQLILFLLSVCELEKINLVSSMCLN